MVYSLVCGKERRVYACKYLGLAVKYIYETSICMISYGFVAVDLLDELSHVLAQCFAARPLTLSMTVERMGACMLLVTVDRETHRDSKTGVKCYVILCAHKISCK